MTPGESNQQVLGCRDEVETTRPCMIKIFVSHKRQVLLSSFTPFAWHIGGAPGIGGSVMPRWRFAVEVSRTPCRHPSRYPGNRLRTTTTFTHIPTRFLGRTRPIPCVLRVSRCHPHVQHYYPLNIHHATFNLSASHLDLRSVTILWAAWTNILSFPLFLSSPPHSAAASLLCPSSALQYSARVLSPISAW